VRTGNTAKQEQSLHRRDKDVEIDAED
jgi:hypothetical protein